MFSKYGKSFSSSGKRLFGGLRIFAADFKREKMNSITFILTVALAAAFVLLVVGLVAVIIYYRYRLKESHRTLARFIKEEVLLQEMKK